MSLKPTYQFRFITSDKDAEGRLVSFNVIEDEQGEIYWAFGHWEPLSFVKEVNRYLRHIDTELELFDPLVDIAGVHHYYARMTGDEHFALCDEDENDLEVFPVTRLML